jgi:hypothetical protein
LPPSGSIKWSGGTAPNVCTGANTDTIVQFFSYGDGIWYGRLVWKECA